MVAIILYYIIIYTLLYIEEKQKHTEGKEEREPGREEGRPPRPLLGEAIATPRHRSTATSSDRAAPRAVGHPARLGPVLFPSVRW